MKIYDCFMYYDEDTVVDIRLNCLDNYVDKLVIVERLQINACDGYTCQFNSGMIFSENNFIDFMTFECDIPPKSKLHPKYSIPS